MFSCFIKLTIPAILTNLASFACVVCTGVFAGRLDDPTKLAVVGLSGVCCNIMILSVMIGLNSAQETLTSQAFGAGNLELCGIYLNRGRFILVAFFIPLAFLVSLYGAEIMVLLG